MTKTKPNSRQFISTKHSIKDLKVKYTAGPSKKFITSSFNLFNESPDMPVQEKYKKWGINYITTEGFYEIKDSVQYYRIITRYIDIKKYHHRVSSLSL